MDQSHVVVTLKIDEVQNAKSFGKEPSFFEKQLIEVSKLICELVPEDLVKPKNKSDKEFNYPHNTISILGPRGIGKTSFILTLEERIKNEEEYKCANKIVWLKKLDPTRMESGETFLVTVVANILKNIQHIIKTEQNEDFCDEKNFRNKLAELSQEFTVLAPQKVHEDQWKDLMGDPDSFAYEILYRERSGLNLARSFGDFLYSCLELQKKTVFVQPIDDIDSAIEHGWSILETLRKYLATPYLITILSGDFDLYKTLIRKQEMDKLRGMLDCESGDMKSRETAHLKSQVVQLTEQYLAKVMPSHLRIRLDAIATQIMEMASEEHEVLSSDEHEIVKISYGGKEDLSLSEVYKIFSIDLFACPKCRLTYTQVLNPSQWPPARLIPSSTRDFVRFLKALNPWYEAAVKNTKEQQDNYGEIHKILTETFYQINRQNALEALVHVFNSALYNGRITLNDLISLKRGAHIEWLAEYCLDARLEIPEIWRLDARYGREEWNHRVLLLQAFLFESWKVCRKQDKHLVNPEGPLSYVIKVLLPCWMAETRDLVEGKLAKMKRIMHTGSTERHVYMAARSLVFSIQEIKEFPNYGVGFINVSKEDVESFVNKNDDRYIFMINWFGIYIYQDGEKQIFYIHILSGLARLVDLLREAPKKDDKGNIKLKSLLKVLIQPRAWYIHKADTEITTADFALGINDLKQIQIQDKHYDSLLKTNELNDSLLKTNELNEWIKNMQNLEVNEILPPPVIARAWTRFIHNIETIPNTRVIDGMLELWICALLNALLIEEELFRTCISTPNIDLQYLTKDVNIFIKNLKHAHNVPYTEEWILCPILKNILKEPTKKSIDQHIQRANNSNKKKAATKKKSTPKSGKRPT